MHKENESIEQFVKNNFSQKRIDTLAKKYKNKKVIIYGASMIFDAIERAFNISGLNIVGIADMRFADGDYYKGYKTYGAFTFMETKPDIVLIVMKESDIAENFFEDAIIPNYGRFKYEPLIKDSFADLIKKIFCIIFRKNYK
jgi:hypothetical protein